MKFEEIIKNPSKENIINFNKQCIKRIEENIKNNGDNWGTKKRQIDIMLEDIETLKNDNKRNIKI